MPMLLLNRLPLRFSLRTLLIIPIILALPLAWIAWPANTARTFVALVYAQRWEEASTMLNSTVDRALLTELQEYLTHVEQPQTKPWQVESKSRSWADMATGRQHFLIRGTHYHFFVARGEVVHMQAWPERSGQDLVIAISDNGGRTWSQPALAAEHGDYAVQSHGLVYDAQVDRAMVLYTVYRWDFSLAGGRGAAASAPAIGAVLDAGGDFTRQYMVTSDDGGQTWTKLTPQPQLRATQCNGSMTTLRDNVGKLTNTVLCSLPLPGNRSEGVVYVSHDGGRNWPIRHDIVAGHFAYSAVVQIDKTTIGLFHEANYHREIRLVRLPIDRLTAKPIDR